MSAVLNVHLGADLKARWGAYCASLGKKPSTVIREAIEAQLAQSAPPLPSASPDTNGKMKRLETRLPPGEYRDLQARLVADGCNSLRQWLRRILKSVPATPYREVEEHPDAEEKKRLEVRLTVSEHAALTERAGQGGMTPQQHLVALARANLVDRPQFGMSEITALGESNYQLLSIGRNLNQIAKRLNEGLPEQVSPADIESLNKTIRAHVEIVSRVMRGNLERWKICHDKV